MDAEYWRLRSRRSSAAPRPRPSLNWAIAEMVLGANPPIWMYGAGPAFAGVLYRNGNERDRRSPSTSSTAGWGTTMVLTEPDAGSDVGAGRTKATANDDGTWNIEGVKRFITSGESDLQREHHPPRAGPPGRRRGRRRPRHQGPLALHRAEVPLRPGDRRADRRAQRRLRHQRRAQDGHQGVQHLRADLRRPAIGGGEPAVGYLLGEVHDGIAQMFQVIENARMMVGTKAIATLSTGYLNALDYAKERVQGADLDPVRRQDRPARDDHPPPRRAPLADGAEVVRRGDARAGALHRAWQDRVQVFEHEDRLGHFSFDHETCILLSTL